MKSRKKMLPIYYNNLLDVLLKEKQQKYTNFLPDRSKTIKDCEEWLEKNLEFELYFKMWKENGYSDELKSLYNALMSQRVEKNVGYIRRNVLYLYIIDKMKEQFTEHDLDWIEQELFTVCLYQNYENIYLSFMIWRIKFILFSLCKNEDIRLYVKENWMDVQGIYRSAQKKFLKLQQLREHYSSDEFNWFKAELYLLDIIFESNKDFSSLEKCILAYQLYRSYHSVEYHLKCGDSLFKLLYFINYNLEEKTLLQLYQMILVCYNKYIQEGENFTKRPLSFTFHLSEGKISLNVEYYNATCEFLFHLTKNDIYLNMRRD